MQECGPNLPSERAKMQSMSLALEEEVAEWMVALYNDDPPELGNFNRFMGALLKRFEDASNKGKKGTE